MLTLPNTARSYWREAYAKALYPKLDTDMAVDVVVVGAGITGLTAAYLLKQAGRSVAVLEKATVGGGTSGRTTGKVTSQHSLMYAELEKQSGDEAAKLYGAANQAALEQISQVIRAEQIDCDWRREANYVFTADPSQTKKFQAEAGAARKAGLPASFVTTTPLPFEVSAAVCFADQATFHAQKYLLGLARAIQGERSSVFEHSPVTGIRDGSPCRVRTRHGTIYAKAVVVATNVPTLPLAARGGYCLLEYPKESYIVAGRFEAELPGMYISPDDTHYSILPARNGAERLLLIGGNDHISGLRGSTHQRYQQLADYAERHFGITEITYRWSDRDYLSYDGVPLIGKLYPWSKHVYVGSAYKKWGLTNGTVAGMILRDLITDRPNTWAALFNANRSHPIRMIPKVVAQYLTGRA